MYTYLWVPLGENIRHPMTSRILFTSHRSDSLKVFRGLLSIPGTVQYAYGVSPAAAQCLPGSSPESLAIKQPISHACSPQQQQITTYRSFSSAAKSQRVLDVADLPPYIILLRHGESAGLENLQEELKIPNHRVPLSARGVQQSFAAGQQVQQLLLTAQSQEAQEQGICHIKPTAQVGNGKLFMYTSPFLRCIQTAQHMARALGEEQMIGFQEEVQLREQDWGNFQAPGQQARNYEERIKYGRFFFRFPDGESAADVYDRMTMFQDHFVRDIHHRRFGGGVSVLLVSHGLAIRLFLMKWLHWTVDEFLQVHNPPTASPIILARQCPKLPDPTPDASGAHVPLEAIKGCYQLVPESLQLVRGVTPAMGAGKTISSRQDLLDWRPYMKQVPPPPAMDPAHEAKLLELMDIGYGTVKA